MTLCIQSNLTWIISFISLISIGEFIIRGYCGNLTCGVCQSQYNYYCPLGSNYCIEENIHKPFCQQDKDKCGYWYCQPFPQFVITGNASNYLEYNTTKGQNVYSARDGIIVQKETNPGADSSKRRHIYIEHPS